MTEGLPPRRALLVVDARGIRRLARGGDWSDTAIANKAMRLLETDPTGAAGARFVAFLAPAPGIWIVMRGGPATDPHYVGARWRELVVLDEAELAQVRSNPFLILSQTVPLPSDAELAELPASELPVGRSVDELRRLGELNQRNTGGTAVDRESMLAAVLESKHTLIVDQSFPNEELELMMLLLPPSMRRELTFLATPESLGSDIPLRLAVTGGSSYAKQSSVWQHRLPNTQQRITPRARSAAHDLLSLIAAGEQLNVTHAVFERYAAANNSTPRDLLNDGDTLTRFERLAAARDAEDAGAALQVFAKSMSVHHGTRHAEPRWTLALACDAVTPSAMGAAVLAALQDGLVDPQVVAVVMERFFRRRKEHVAEFNEFVRPFEASPGTLNIDGHSPGVMRIRTMLLLLAAARGEVTAIADALPLVADRELLAQLGGVDAWLSTKDGTVGAVVRALLEIDEPEHTAVTLTALVTLARTMLPGRQQVRLVDVAAACTRSAFRRLSVDDWRSGRPHITAGTELCRLVLSSTRLGLAGHTDEEHFRKWLDRSSSGSFQVDLHTDAEVFFGFLGVEGSRSRLAPRELSEHGAALVRELHTRMVRADAARTPNEGVHWSVGLLDRTRSGKVDPAYTELAFALLHKSSPDTANVLIPEILADGATPAAVQSAALAAVAAANAPPDEPEPELNREAPPADEFDKLRGELKTAADHHEPTLPRRRLRKKPVAVLAAVLAGFVVMAGALGLLPTQPLGSAVTPASEIATSPTSNAALATRPVGERVDIAQLRQWADSNDWGRIVSALSTEAVPSGAPDSFAKDSLLAHGALAQALLLPPGAARRDTLLRLTSAAAEHAMGEVGLFTPGADLMRLLRAQACMAGQQDCDPSTVLQDLILAARSASHEVSARATEALANWRR